MSLLLKEWCSSGFICGFEFLDSIPIRGVSGEAPMSGRAIAARIKLAARVSPPPAFMRSQWPKDQSCQCLIMRGTNTQRTSHGSNLPADQTPDREP